jgi:RNA polymerase sigma factor for flagellar operon FliA
MEAIDKFELSRNIKFETFASRRVRGAILDSLRKEDLLPKNVRDQAKKIESAYITLESRLGRTATDDEVAAELGVTKEEFYVILDKTRAISLFSFDSELFSKDGEKFKLEDLIGEESSSLIEFEKKEAVEKLAAIIETFEKEERIILETYYWDGLNFREIGKVLDISESRVCQIHTKLILKLRSSFKKLHNER